MSSTVFIFRFVAPHNMFHYRSYHPQCNQQLGSRPPIGKKIQIWSSIVTNTDPPILREHERTNWSRIIFLQSQSRYQSWCSWPGEKAVLSVPVTVWWWGGGEGMWWRGGVVMSELWRLWTQTSIYLQVSGPSAGSSSARPPLAAFDREEEEEGNDCCLATGGSRVIS